MTAITGLVLAGGRGARMGGSDKGLVPLADRPLVRHVVERLRPQVQQLLICANRNLERYAALGLPVCHDSLPDFAGPLAGLQAGLQQCQTPYLVMAPCDAPFLPLDLVARLWQGLHAAQAEAALAVTDEAGVRQVHPVFCLVAVSLLPQLDQFLLQGGRGVNRWLATVPAVEVTFGDAAAFRNLNTPADVQQCVGP